MQATRMNRRAFLTRSAAAVSSLALTPALAGASAQPAAAQGSVAQGAVRLAAAGASPDRWQALQRIAGERLLRPGSSGYDLAAAPNNLRFAHIQPDGILLCHSAQLVADALRWCQDYDMPFAIRGGGHSYAGYSLSQGLVISMRDLHAISYDPATRQAQVQAGALNGQIYGSLQAAQRTITHGRCPTVGAAGFLLGGGIGFNMRRYGMGSDHIVQAQIVTADGRVRTLSDRDDPDLFWAIRGGAGGNFGVSTSFTLRTEPVDTVLTAFRIVWRNQSLKAAKALFAALDQAPDTIGTRIALGGVTPEQVGKGRQVPLTLLGQFAGSPQALQAILAPALAAATPEHTDIRELDYWAAQGFLLEEGAPGRYRERSAFLSTAPTDAFLEQAYAQLQQWPGTGAQSSLFFFQTGGKVNAVAPDATAFVHRSSRWLGVVGANWSADDAARPEIVRRATAWQDALYALMNHSGGAGAFQNFADGSLVDWRERYYGANLPRLQHVKAVYDPNNLFQFGQAI